MYTGCRQGPSLSTTGGNPGNWLTEERHSEIKNQRLARGRAHPRESVDGGSFIHGAPPAAPSHLIEPSETIYTFQQGAINAGFIFFALAILATLSSGVYVCRLGLPHSRSPGFLVIPEESWPHAAAFSVPAPGLCPRRRRSSMLLSLFTAPAVPIPARTRDR